MRFKVYIVYFYKLAWKLMYLHCRDLLEGLVT